MGGGLSTQLLLWSLRKESRFVRYSWSALRKDKVVLRFNTELFDVSTTFISRGLGEIIKPVSDTCSASS